MSRSSNRTSGIDALEYVGRRVQKEFKGHGVFKGKVIDFDRVNGFRIEYEDGDTEDVTQATLEKLLAETPKEEPRIPLYGTSDMPKRTAIPSSTVTQYCTNTRAAARRKRKHTELKRSGILERRRLENVAAAARSAAPKERVTLHKRPGWAEGLDRESRTLQCDATRAGEQSKAPASRTEHDVSLYRLKVEVHGGDSASVQWWFPPANPGSRNAWIGLYFAEHVIWGEDSECGSVGSGGHKLAWRCITVDKQYGAMKFSKLFGTSTPVPDGDYVFTLQPDYGTECKAVSERLRVRDRQIVAVMAGSGLISDAGMAVHRHARQQSASLGLINVHSTAAAPDVEVEDERCYFPVHSINVNLGENYQDKLPLLKLVYRIVDKESRLDWGLTSDYLGGEPEVDEEVEKHRLRKKGEPAPADAAPPPMPSQYSATLPAAAHRTKRDDRAVRGLGGGTLGSEGYGEATTASAHKIGVLLQNLRQLVLNNLCPHMHWGLLWDLGPHSSFLDIGSGYGKVVLHLRLLAGMRRSVGVECVASRVHIANKALYTIEVEKDSHADAQAKKEPKPPRAPCSRPPPFQKKPRPAKGKKKAAAAADADADAVMADADEGEGGAPADADAEPAAPPQPEDEPMLTAQPEDDAASAASSASTDAVPQPDDAAPASPPASPPSSVVPWLPLDTFSGVEFEHGDATKAEKLNYSHIYIFDWVFSKHTLHAVAEVLQRSPFYVMMSTRKPAEWWSYGLVKAQPVCKLSGFRTTGGEGMTLYVYINLEKVPQAAA